MAKLKTGRHTSALKERRKTVVRTQVNRKVRKNIKLMIRKIETAVAGQNREEATKLLGNAFSLIDKAKKKLIIHPNNAARKKRRISLLVARGAKPQA